MEWGVSRWDEVADLAIGAGAVQTEEMHFVVVFLDSVSYMGSGKRMRREQEEAEEVYLQVGGS
jgi:hypothetical protein